MGGGGAGFEYGVGNYLLWAMGGSQRTGDYNTPIGRIENSGTKLRQTSAGIARYGQQRVLGSELPVSRRKVWDCRGTLRTIMRKRSVPRSCRGRYQELIGAGTMSVCMAGFGNCREP